MADTACERAQAQIKREKNGKYQKGSSGNPLGRPSTGFQSLNDRLDFWMETKTIAEIEKIIKNKKVWRSLCALDAGVAMWVSEVYQKGGWPALMALLDRRRGKPAQAITGEDGNPLIPVADLSELARRTAFLLSLATNQPPVIEHTPQVDLTKHPPTRELVSP